MKVRPLDGDQNIKWEKKGNQNTAAGIPIPWKHKRKGRMILITLMILTLYKVYIALSSASSYTVRTSKVNKHMHKYPKQCWRYAKQKTGISVNMHILLKEKRKRNKSYATCTHICMHSFSCTHPHKHAQYIHTNSLTFYESFIMGAPWEFLYYAFFWNLN